MDASEARGLGVSQLWASQGCVGTTAVLRTRRPHCVIPAVTGSLLGKAPVAKTLGEVLPPVWLGVWQSLCFISALLETVGV